VHAVNGRSRSEKVAGRDDEDGEAVEGIETAHSPVLNQSPAAAASVPGTAAAGEKEVLSQQIALPWLPLYLNRRRDCSEAEASHRGLRRDVIALNDAITVVPREDVVDGRSEKERAAPRRWREHARF
jgi:hypothetical protein